jgi:hypothetical protein
VFVLLTNDIANIPRMNVRDNILLFNATEIQRRSIRTEFIHNTFPNVHGEIVNSGSHA